MQRLLDFIFPPRADELTLREVTDETLLALIAPAVVDETYPGTIALLPFAHPSVRAALHEAKYHGSRRAFRLLGTILAEYLREADDLGPAKSHIILVPVPLGTARHKERGFNQVEQVVRSALTHLSAERAFILDTTLLTRTRETPTQVALPREERAKNMRGAFRARGPINPAYLYIVVDDVVTTGATLQAAIDALASAGAVNSIPLALAH